MSIFSRATGTDWIRAHQAFPQCTCHHDTTARTCTVTCDLDPECVFLPLHTLS